MGRRRKKRKTIERLGESYDRHRSKDEKVFGARNILKYKKRNYQ